QILGDAVVSYVLQRVAAETVVDEIAGAPLQRGGAVDIRVRVPLVPASALFLGDRGAGGGKQSDAEHRGCEGSAARITHGRSPAAAPALSFRSSYRSASAGRRGSRSRRRCAPGSRTCPAPAAARGTPA